MIPLEVQFALRHAQLPPAQKYVMLWLCSVAAPDCLAYPGERGIAYLTGFSRRTVQRALRALTEAGWLRRLGRRGGRGGGQVIYELQIPEQAQ